MMLITLLLISLTAAVPSIYVAGQREREEELIFRGTEYARAIAFFHRRFNRFPASVDELLRTSGIRFLRHPYPDPMSQKGKWRFVHANALGMVLDSRTLPRPPGAGPMPGASATGLPAGSSGPGGLSSDTNEIKGAFIVGVASSSHQESIRVWNNRTHYDEWEFLGVETGASGVGSVLPGPAGLPGMGGAPPPTMPTGPPGPSPFPSTGTPPTPR